MIYCSRCKQTVSVPHTRMAGVKAPLRKSEDAMKPRNFAVIDEKDQGNPPHVRYFEKYDEAEADAVRRSRDSHRGYEIFRLEKIARVTPREPIVSKTF